MNDRDRDAAVIFVGAALSLVLLTSGILLAVLGCSCTFALTDAELDSATTPLEHPIELRAPDDMLDDFTDAGRPPRVRTWGDGYTVLPDAILLPPDWPDNDEESVQQRSLAHEWAHVSDDVDPAKWTASRRYRALVELHGDLERGRAAIRQGRSREVCEQIVRESYEAVPQKYRINLDRAWLRDTAIPMAQTRACGGE